MTAPHPPFEVSHHSLRLQRIKAYYMYEKIRVQQLQLQHEVAQIQQTLRFLQAAADAHTASSISNTNSSTIIASVPRANLPGPPSVELITGFSSNGFARDTDSTKTKHSINGVNSNITTLTDPTTGIFTDGLAPAATSTAAVASSFQDRALITASTQAASITAFTKDTSIAISGAASIVPNNDAPVFTYTTTGITDIASNITFIFMVASNGIPNISSTRNLLPPKLFAAPTLHPVPRPPPEPDPTSKSFPIAKLFYMTQPLPTTTSQRAPE